MNCTSGSYGHGPRGVDAIHRARAGQSNQDSVLRELMKGTEKFRPFHREYHRRMYFVRHVCPTINKRTWMLQCHLAERNGGSGPRPLWYVDLTVFALPPLMCGSLTPIDGGDVTRQHNPWRDCKPACPDGGSSMLKTIDLTRGQRNSLYH